MTKQLATELDAVCARYSLDPADVLGVRDPYLRWIVRTAVYMNAEQPRSDGSSPTATVDDLIALAREEGGIA